MPTQSNAVTTASSCVTPTARLEASPRLRHRRHLIIPLSADLYAFLGALPKQRDDREKATSCCISAAARCEQGSVMPHWTSRAASTAGLRPSVQALMPPRT